MLRRTVLLLAVGSMVGCQGPNGATNSAFKMPTPSFNLLAPYGTPRVPPPATHSYGQPGLLAPPAAASTPQPYYPSGSVRGASSTQSPEAGGAPAAPAQGKVAAAVWKSTRSASGEDDAEAASAPGALASHTAGAHDDGAVRIPEASPPSEPVPLQLGGMRAHDLTVAVRTETPLAAPLVMAQAPAIAAPASTMVLASAAPVTPQVIYTAPVEARPAPVVASPAPVVASPTTVVASQTVSTAAPVPGASTPGRLVEITELPPAANSNPGLQRVRGFDQPAAASGSGAGSAVFISPQMTISASTSRETRDAVAAAALQADEPTVQAAPAEPAAGWKSRFSLDES